MIQVIKRDGTKEDLDLNKFHRVAEFACEGLAGVSVSDLEVFYRKLRTPGGVSVPRC